MGTVTMTTGSSRGILRYADGHPRAYLQDTSGRRLYMSFAPQESENTGGQDQYSLVDIVGSRPNVRRTADGLMQLSFTFGIAYEDRRSIEPLIATWRTMYTSGRKVMVGGMGASWRGWWRISDQSLHENDRQFKTNAATWADLSVTLIEDRDVRPKIGSRATSRPPSKKPPTPHPKSPSSKTRVITVKSGDSLFGLAVKYLGNGERWKEIYKMNRLKSTTLRVGQKLKIPPR